MREKTTGKTTKMRHQANQHNALNRARFTGVTAVEGAGWLSQSADPGATVKDSITMTLKRAAGGLFQGGIPF
jgi:hypothetical protein